MKPWMILGLSAGLCACVFNGHASAANFYTISGVTTNTVNYFSELNLIQGPGVGFDANVPHDALSGANTWVTNDPGGYPSDYIAVAGQPIIELDLGEDVNLEEISTWGYAASNTNGVSQFSLRFATEAEGPTGYGTSITFNPTYSMIQDPVPRQSFIFGQSITARYVEFTALDNFYVAPGSSGGDRVGLGEIAFATAAADQLWILIDRETGNMAITNQTPSNSYTISGYDITSTIGALNPANWLSIAANYDANSGGTIDPNNNWIEFGAASDDIAEGTLGALAITPGMTINLGNLWIQNPAESMQFVMLQEDGTRLNPLVRYIGNNDLPFESGDLNFDGAIDVLDWPIYRNGYHADLSALSGAQAYQQGDMNFDGVNNRLDYTLFKTAYETANGPGSFDAMLAGVPEPAAWILFLFACATWAAHRFRVRFRGILVPGLAAAICSMVIGLGTTQADLPSIVSHWTLDADGSDSVGTNNGTPNAVTFGQAGANANTGTAALFDGSTSTINVPYSADLNPTSFTAVLWANAALFDTGHHSPLTCRDDYNVGVSTHGYIIYNAPNGVWEFWTGDGDPGWASVGGGSVATSTWTHLAISFDSFTKMKSFYVNGTLAGSTTLQGYSPNGTVESENLHIGSGNDPGDSFFFNGLIDDVAVYEGVLNQVEIQHVANNGVSAFELFRLTLQVNADTGATSLRNDTGFAIDIDQYEILSAGNALNASGWYSLQEQDYEGSGGTSGEGDGWEVLGTPGAGFVGEAYLQASSNLADTTSISLGSLFNPAGPQDLVFSYRLADGSFWDGIVEYVTGGDNADFNADGDVDGADFLAWQIGFGTTGSATRADGDANGDANVNGADLAIWKTQFGMGGAPGGLSGTAIPEPNTLGLFGLACICLAVTLLRHQGGRIMNKSKLIWIGMVVVFFTYVQSTLANSETDRLYHLGDDPWDGAVANNTVTSTADSYYVDAGEGDRQNLEDYYFTEPTYVNVGSGPYARSGASPGDLGIRFDGTDDFL
ncbi:MAG: hypothetical protein JW829_10485, partial [Pirellulales bacterium]|nr:hypothetical protein [Pirellulales bacterium]